MVDELMMLVIAGKLFHFVPPPYDGKNKKKGNPKVSLLIKQVLMQDVLYRGLLCFCESNL